MLETKLTISLENIKENLRRVKTIIGRNVKFCFVVKGDAYGFGLKKIVDYCKSENSYDYYGVSQIGEAKQILRLDTQRDIYVMQPVPLQLLPKLKEEKLILSIGDWESLETLEKHAAKQRFHLKFDTGMGVDGFTTHDLPHLQLFFDNHQNLKLEGCFSHFVTTYTAQPKTIETQWQEFLEIQQVCTKFSKRKLLFHMSASSTFLHFPVAHLDMVRIAGAIYNQTREDFKPVATLKSYVRSIKTEKIARAIGYGQTFTAKAGHKIAIVGSGHADGINAFFSHGKGEVIIKGKKYRIEGRIMMDGCFVDLKDDQEIEVGDEVIFLGKQGSSEIVLSDLNKELGHWNTFANSIGARVERQYIQ